MPRYTKGPIVSNLLKLAAPIVLANLLHMAYQLIDTFWVGRLGADAVAALSISFSIYFLLVSLGSGFALAGTILVAQLKGGKEYDTLNYVSTQTFLVMGVLAIIITAVGIPLVPYIITLIGGTGNVHLLATQYMQILLAGTIFQYAFFVFESLMRGVGDPKTPLYIVATTVLLNAILDPIFIMGWGPIPSMGVAGAAITTVITTALASIVGVALLLSKKYKVQFTAKGVSFDWKLYKKLFRIGLPSSIEQSNRALGFMTIVYLVTLFGTAATAAYGIGVRVLTLVIIPALGFGIATSTMVGQNIGAGKINRAEKVAKTAMGIAFFGVASLGIFTFFGAEAISAFFVPGEPEVIAQSSVFIKSLSLVFGFVGLQMCTNGVFRAAGLTQRPMFFSILQHWFFRIPFSILFITVLGFGVEGLWYAFPIASFLTGLIAYIWFRTGSWKKEKITKDILLQAKTQEATKIDIPEK